MSFLETPRFADRYSVGFSGGPSFARNVINELPTGVRSIQINQDYPIYNWRLTQGPHAPDYMAGLIAFYNAVMGPAVGFRFKDVMDYQTGLTTGYLSKAGLGTGAPGNFQAYKIYSAGAEITYRKLIKLVSGTYTVYLNGVAVTQGVGNDQCAVDNTTGVVTFTGGAAKTITGITKANPGVVTANSHGFSNGDSIYISGVVGMTQVNNLAFIISSVTTNTFAINANTTSYTTYTSGGIAKKYPQPNEQLRIVTEFDVPVNFSNPESSVSFDGQFARTWASIEIRENISP